jgi:hypothetical protein
MTKTAKVYPFLNKFSGAIQIMTKAQGKELSEDWAVPKVVKNDKNETVYRFELAAEVKDRDGKVQSGIATVDIKETETVVSNGDRKSE